MTVATILNAKGREVARVESSVTLGEAVRELADRKIGALVVCDGSDTVLGILSERDIVRELARAGASALAEPVSEHMTSKVITCSDASTVDECMAAMTEGRFRHMPVVQDGRLAGIISIGDIVKEKIAAAVREAEAMRNYIVAG